MAHPLGDRASVGEADKPLGALSEGARSFGDARVLLVDDSQLIRMGLRRSLEQIGLVHVREVGDGDTAIEVLMREPFDLMLLDMEMPKRNGMQVLELMRESPHFA